MNSPPVVENYTANQFRLDLCLIIYKTPGLEERVHIVLHSDLFPFFKYKSETEEAARGCHWDLAGKPQEESAPSSLTRNCLRTAQQLAIPQQLAIARGIPKSSVPTGFPSLETLETAGENHYSVRCAQDVCLAELEPQRFQEREKHSHGSGKTAPSNNYFMLSFTAHGIHYSLFLSMFVLSAI